MRKGKRGVERRPVFLLLILSGVCQSPLIPSRHRGDMIAAPGGTLHLIDSGALKRVAPDGVVTTLSRSVAARSLRQFHVGDHHSLMGLGSTARERVRRGVRGRRGEAPHAPGSYTTKVLRSRVPWSPTGGMFAPNGDPCLMETTITNRVRLRRISPSGKSKSF